MSDTPRYTLRYPTKDDFARRLRRAALLIRAGRVDFEWGCWFVKRDYRPSPDLPYSVPVPPKRPL